LLELQPKSELLIEVKKQGKKWPLKDLLFRKMRKRRKMKPQEMMAVKRKRVNEK